MHFQTLSFDIAYQSYYDEIEKSVSANIEILEIGGGAHPSLTNRDNLSYTIVDPDKNELNKSPEDILKLNLSLEQLDTEKQYDLILTKMVLEHIENPEAFHKKIYKTLKPNGKVIHFFACRNSIPSIANRLLPEFIGDSILRMIGNRNLKDSPKYPAYYRKTKGYCKSQINFFTELKFKIEKYDSFVGHKYFQKVPVLGILERFYSKLLVSLRLKSLSTVALITLTKEIQN